MKKLCIIGMIMLIAVSAGAQTPAKIDYNSMNRDIRIMEKAMVSLLTDENSVIGIGEIKGIYLDKYGVVFNVPIYRKATEPTAIKLQNPPDDPQTIAQIEKKVNEEVQRMERSKLASSTSKLRSSIIVFFGSYADVIKQLEPNDVITVFAIAQERRGDNVTVKSGTAYGALYTPQQAARSSSSVPQLNSFLMSVKKEDITIYRKNSKSLKKFYQAVSYAEISGSINIPGTLATDIKVIKGIIETVLEDTLHTTIPPQSVQSAYLKNYGVLYFVDVGYIPQGISSTSFLRSITNYSISGYELLLTDSTRKKLQLQQELALSKYKAGLFPEENKSFETLPDVLLEMLGDYGRMIRGLQQDDQITIFVKSSGILVGKDTLKNLITTVKYKDIQEYSEKKITLETLKSRASSRYFN
jgi:hypothetical protein